MIPNPMYMKMVAQEQHNNRLRDAENERLIRAIRGQRVNPLVRLVRNILTALASKIDGRATVATYKVQQSCCYEMAAK